MSSILERARRARHHYGTDAPTTDSDAENAQSIESEPPLSPATSTIVPPRYTPIPPSAGADAARHTLAAGAPGGQAKIARTRTGGTWVAVVVAVLVLVFLLIFVLQNMTSASVSFLGAQGTLPLGVAMLFAAIAGALLVALIGSVRILQLRHNGSHRH